MTRKKLVGLLAVVLLVVVGGIAMFLLPFDSKAEEIPQRVVEIQITEMDLKAQGVVTDTNLPYIGLEAYADEDYIYYYDAALDIIRAIEQKSGASVSPAEITDDKIKDNARSLVKLALGSYVTGELAVRLETATGLKEVFVTEYVNGERTGDTGYCIFDEKGILISSSFSVVVSSQASRMEITKEDAVEIFLMHLKTEYPESASLVESISARDFEEVEELTVKENTIQGEACWQITLYLDMEDWVTLENGGRLSGYGADIAVNTGSILHGSPTK